MQLVSQYKNCNFANKPQSMRKLTFLLFLALTAPIGLQANNINDMDAAQTSPGSASQRPLSSSAAELAP